MDFINSFTDFMFNAVQAGTPIMLAILGGILFEKVGNLNLGIEVKKSATLTSELKV